jgi:hypothetical protein
MSENNKVSPKAAALQGLPQEWREEMIARASSMGIHSDDDVAWLLVGSFVNAWAAAAAAGKAATSVDANVKIIPDMIYQGTVSASDTLGKVVLEKGSAAAGSIAKAGENLSNKIKGDIEKILGGYSANLSSAASNAVSQAMAARHEVIKSGVREFSELAADAVRENMRGISIRQRYFAFLVGAVVVCVAFFCGIIAVGMIQYPHLVQKNEQWKCGTAYVLGIGKRNICVSDGK